MVVLTFAQLAAACNTSKDGSVFYSSFLNDALKVLYYTGCRPVELLDSSRWAIDNFGEITLQPAKNNLPRVIPAAPWPVDFVKWIQFGSSAFSLVTYSKIKNLHEKVWPYPQCYVLNKAIDPYVYRHHYVQKLANDGMTLPQIVAAMGWRSDQVANRYINSSVYYF
tara:strand:+ start:1305 stop:1802 length:498 start_codon:yes stop_codon:yes gene_type:complete